ncbi:MAG TPA: DUF4129 domain-containing protein [Candidatus Sulfomarinibacteraceae bacterium]|nr:DUF4129 domain-containing protein [Candidatus Sulfomarinibacteraceae bacterium]
MFPFRLHHLLTAALLLLLPLVVVASPVSAQNPEGELALHEYRQLVSDTRRMTELAESGDEEAREALSMMAERWRAVEHVMLPNGDQIAVDHTPIVSALSAGEPDTAGLLLKLEALEAVSGRWPAATMSHPDAAQAVTELEAILRDPQFQWAEEEPSLQQLIWDYLLRLLRRMLPDSLEGSPLLSRLMTGAALLFLLAVLLYAARTFLQSFSPATSTVPEGPSADGHTSHTALQQAQDFSRSGDYRTAVRYLYLSTLLLLDERGILRYDRTRTNGEYLESVARRPELAGTLKNVIDVFDRVWYGYQPLDSDAYAWYEDQVRKLRQLK